MKKDFPYKWECLNKKLAYLKEFVDTIDDYKKHVDKLKKEDFCFKLKNKCPDDEEIEGTKEIIELFDDNKKGERVTKLYCKSDVIF